MDVYLIPVGSGRYELYCEDVVEGDEIASDVPPAGRLTGLYLKFKAAFVKLEAERQAGVAPGSPRRWTRRIKDRALRWIAERMAEQRLLWRLRTQSDVQLFHPDDLSPEQAPAIARTMLQRDADHHLRWTIVDGALFAASGVVMLIPGPNLLAYYFGFRLVGHYLSRQGAQHALARAEWRTCSSAQLSRLRLAVALGSHERAQHVHRVASELHLPHLPRFFERISIHSA